MVIEAIVKGNRRRCLAPKATLGIYLTSSSSSAEYLGIWRGELVGLEDHGTYNDISRTGFWDGIERVVAIVGCQRSGTTLTGQIVGAHPEAFLVDEFDGLYPWFHAETDRRHNAAALAEAMVKSAEAKYRQMDKPRCLGGAVTAGDIGARVLVLKAPNLTYDVGRFSSLGTPVSVVYPVRDPRAVVASMARLSHIDFVGNQLRLLNDRPELIERFTAEYRLLADEAQPQWIRQAAIWNIKSSMAPTFRQAGICVTQFRYEDLVCEPDRMISRILDECHLPDSAEALRSHALYRGEGPGGTDRTRPIDATSLFVWQSDLDEAQQADVIHITGASARSFGYG